MHKSSHIITKTFRGRKCQGHLNLDLGHIYLNHIYEII